MANEAKYAQSGLQGAASGAAMGAAGGPVGMGIGAAVGLGVGLFGASQDSGSYSGYSKGDMDRLISDRSSQIDKFSSLLDSAHADYMTQITALDSAAFKQFMPDLAAHLASKGLTADSGAFTSAAAREAVNMRAGLATGAYTSQVNNLNSVNNARAGVFDAALGSDSKNFLAQTPPNPVWGALGQLGGQVAGYSLKKLMNTPGTETPGTAPMGNPPAASNPLGLMAPQPTPQRMYANEFGAR